MKPQNLIHILILTVCLAFSPKVQAVSPPPDGCYPGFTTAEGCNALSHLTTGAGNTGVGWYSLFANATGTFNTAVGAGALDLNTADNNTAIGVAALLLNTTGTNNTANGVGALVITTAAPVTPPMERSHSLVTPPAAVIQPPVRARFSATSTALKTQPTGLMR